MSEEIRGKLAVKAKNGKGFKIEDVDGWFNATDNAKPYLEKIEVGAEVVVNYTKKGISKNVTKIAEAKGQNKSTTKTESKSTEVKKGTGTFVCEDCGVELKNDKYPKCYTCGKKAYKKSTKKTSYDSPEKTAQIQRGNALNAAGYVMSGFKYEDPAKEIDPETLAEMTIVVAEKFLEWLRAE